MKTILYVLVTIVALQLRGDNLIDVVDEAEQYIGRTYKGEMARRLALDKLQKILDDRQKTDKEKMDVIRLEFLAPKKEDEDIKICTLFYFHLSKNIQNKVSLATLRARADASAMR